MKNHLYVVILCGGGGTRVWPLSVTKKPKQFLNFYSNKTLYQETYVRARQLVDADHIIAITNETYVQEIKDQTPELPEENIIGEPEKKNTALAMGVAAAYVYQKDPDGIIINLASDHVISDEKTYFATLLSASNIAYEDKQLVSVGIQPAFAHPGLGYIHLGKEIKEVDGLSVSKVAEFKEKPDAKTAEKYLATGEYLWNANNYIWRADVILKEFDQLSPEIAQSIRSIQTVIGSDKQMSTLKKEYAVAPEEPIDTAISEKTNRLVVIPGTFGWNDIGGWQVVYDLGKKDETNSVVVHSNDQTYTAPVMQFDSKNNLIYAADQPIGVIGLSDIVVVDTGRGLLVCDKKRSNDVKKIVQALKASGDNQYL